VLTYQYRAAVLCPQGGISRPVLVAVMFLALPPGNRRCSASDGRALSPADDFPTITLFHLPGAPWSRMPPAIGPPKRPLVLEQMPLPPSTPRIGRLVPAFDRANAFASDACASRITPCP